MTMTNLAGIDVELGEDGYMVDHMQWNEDIAKALAAEEGLGELTPRHWDVINFMRQEFISNGAAPSIRRLKNSGGIPTKELYQLFPGGPAKKAARIAGIPKPHGCI